jgi:O-acetyl-ADP-ribose deacetylase (regulator of RNase III)
MIEIKRDNILNSNEKYIIHQCNCITNNALGLAETLFTKYTYADEYNNRKKYSIPGTISIKGDGDKFRYIINAFAQFSPGKASLNETKENRLQWFKECLDEIEKIEDLESVAFPYKIGCGYGGGDWNDYLKLIEQFSEKSLVKVVIYQL